jgi:hypothetical protein
MPEPKTVTVMADCGAFPIWLGGGAFMVRPEELPLSDSLKFALQEWSAFYDHTLMSNGYEWPSTEVQRDFVERGRTLARSVAASLGGDFFVLYFNDETGEREPISAE